MIYTRKLLEKIKGSYISLETSHAIVMNELPRILAEHAEMAELLEDMRKSGILQGTGGYYEKLVFELLDRINKEDKDNG